jgi:hypothetical protein
LSRSSCKEPPGPPKSVGWQLLCLEVRTVLHWGMAHSYGFSIGSPRRIAAIEETTQDPTNSTVYVISSEDEVNVLVGAIKNVTLYDVGTLQ